MRADRDVLEAIRQLGTGTVASISRRSGWPERCTRAQLLRLAECGYVDRVSLSRGGGGGAVWGAVGHVQPPPLVEEPEPAQVVDIRADGWMHLARIGGWDDGTSLRRPDVAVEREHERECPCVNCLGRLGGMPG